MGAGEDGGMRKKQDIKSYYTAPSDKVFEDCRKNAIKIWKTYDDEFGYASEKVDRIRDIGNISDNFMYIVAMFDIENQEKLLNMVKPETKKEIVNRLPDDYVNYFEGVSI